MSYEGKFWPVCSAESKRHGWHSLQCVKGDVYDYMHNVATKVDDLHIYEKGMLWTEKSFQLVSGLGL